MSKVRHRIKAVRESKGIKARFVADKIGVSRSYYSQIENGHVGLTLKNAQQIAEVLGTNILDLLDVSKESKE